MMLRLSSSNTLAANRHLSLAPHQFPRNLIRCESQSGRPDLEPPPFNENVAQVKRLISRDRKEFLQGGVTGDILERFSTEFGDGTTTPASQPSTNPFTSASSSSPAVSPASANPFTSAPVSNPFSSGQVSSPVAAPKPFKQSIEPTGLFPSMSPDPVVKETPFSILQSIGLTQIAIVFSFSLIIGLMLATFTVVLNAGGIRIAGLE